MKDGMENEWEENNDFHDNTFCKAVKMSKLFRLLLKDLLIGLQHACAVPSVNLI